MTAQIKEQHVPKNDLPADPIVITVDELTGRLGCSGPEPVYHWMKKQKLDLVNGHVFAAAPADEPVQGLPIEQADRLLREVRDDWEQHQTRWQAYVAYREERKRKAHEERVRQAAEAHHASLEASRRQAKRYEAAAAEQAAHEAAQLAAARAAHEGRPVDFETFVESA